MKKRIEDPIDILGHAYESMYEDTAREFHKAEEKTAPVLRQLIDKAKQKLLEAEKISAEEADEIADAVARDLGETINYFAETGRELKDWLGFETSFLETELFDALLKTADPTAVEWKKLEMEAGQPELHTGQFTGPGTLVCNHCGESLHFYRAGRIPPCPKCKGSEFHRKLD